MEIPDKSPDWALRNGGYSREDLVAICEAAVVNQSDWLNRDSPGAHEQLGLCWVMLKAGCDFYVHSPKPGDRGCHTDDRTIWLTVHWKTFAAFEYGNEETKSDTFYIPTPKRLNKSIGTDWY